MDIFQIILDSGFVVKMVLLVLIIMSVASWAIVIYYFRFYKEMEVTNGSFLTDFFKDKITSFASINDLNNKVEKYTGSPFYFIWKNFYRELQTINDKVSEKEDMDLATYLELNEVENFERSIHKGVNQATQMVDKHRSVLASIATVTPFIGLFGTVWGIINSFNGLSSGGGSIESVAPGIAEALVATAVGLFAAIPASWFYNIFSKKLQNLKMDMNSFSQDLLNLLKYYSIR